MASIAPDPRQPGAPTVRQAVVNPTPKQRFQESPQVISSHRDMIATREFQRAADFALLQYSAQLASTNTNTNEALGNAFKLQGAVEFLGTLRMLGETPRRPVAIESPNLDHSV